jgi:hypothetical protein
VSTQREEGWYTDPFGLHEARWMSGGTPTKLVRDGDEESYDDPPDEEPSHPPEPIKAPPPPEGADAGGFDDLNERIREAGQFGATWGAHVPLPNRHDK